MAFKYQERSSKRVKERATQRGGTFDSVIDNKFPYFKPKEGDNLVRILPPTWKQEDPHYGFDVWVHRDIGADKNMYVCLKKMKKGNCPICDAANELDDEATPEDIKALKPQRVVAVWIIDRDDAKAGPKIWTMSWTMDRDIAQLSQNKRSGEIYLIDHPEDGYDVEFTRTGAGLKTKYSGIRVARDPSPISKSSARRQEWLDYITENPVPKCINFFEEGYIDKVFNAKKTRDDDDDDDGDRPSRSKKSKRRDDDDDDDRPSRAARRGDDDDDEEEDKPAKKKKAQDDDEDDEDRPAKKKKARDDDDEDDDDNEPPARKKKVRSDDDDDDGETPAKKKKARDDDDDDDEDDDEETPAKKKARDDDDDDADDRPAKKKKARDDDDDEIPSRHRRGKSDDDDDDDDDRTDVSSKTREKLKKLRRGD